MKIDIQKNIPIPISRNGRPFKYPLCEMEVGDSFFVPFEDRSANSVQASVNSCALRYKPNKFITRRVVGGIQCWRVA